VTNQQLHLQQKALEQMRGIHLVTRDKKGEWIRKGLEHKGLVLSLSLDEK
jgi:hypothetical protein